MTASTPAESPSEPSSEPAKASPAAPTDPAGSAAPTEPAGPSEPAGPGEPAGPTEAASSTTYTPGSARVGRARFAPPRSRQAFAGIGRRGWTWIVAGSLAVIVVLICGAIVAVTAAVRGTVGESRHDRAVEAAARTDVEAACLELEQRLNRLTPPGATTGPAARAEAIRDENVAARPFLLELERIRTARDDDPRGERPDEEDPRDEDYLAQAWPDGWRQVIEARASYAEALDRAAGGGDPAFYLAPRDENAASVADRLLTDGPDGCDGVLRRLTSPSL